jgi:hypothetical protein
VNAFLQVRQRETQSHNSFFEPTTELQFIEQLQTEIDLSLREADLRTPTACGKPLTVVWGISSEDELAICGALGGFIYNFGKYMR